MTTFKSRLDAAGQSAAAYVHKIRLWCAADAKSHFVHVEGNRDLDYYSSCLSRIGKANWHIEKSGSKKKTIASAQEIQRRGAFVDRNSFCVDRDYDEILGNHAVPDTVFITDPYSVEGYLVGNDFSEYYLLNIGGLDNKFRATIRSNYKHYYAKYFKLLYYICSILLHCRRNKIVCNATNFQIKNVINVDKNGSISLNVRWFDIFKRKTDLNTRILQWDDIIVEYKFLKSVSIENAIRNKWLFEFVFIFIKSETIRIKILKDAGAADYQSFRLNPEASEDAVFERICGHANVPESFDRFVRSRVP
jgi:hypothetical protein